MIHAELHDAVDAFAACDAFVKSKDGFVDHRHQDAIRDEAWRVLTIERDFAELFGQCSDFFLSFDGSGHAADDFDQLHHRNGIHEVHAYDFVGSLRGGG